MKDESVLKNLVQQEGKKKESVRNAEMKITKLTEQLQATEKILTVNRMFLKKLQEQVIFNHYNAAISFLQYMLGSVFSICLILISNMRHICCYIFIFR